MARDTGRGRLVLAAWGWLVVALVVTPFASALERGVVLVQQPLGEQARSAIAHTALDSLIHPVLMH